jgi:uncharacterized damage-inducible protein DinB
MSVSVEQAITIGQHFPQVLSNLGYFDQLVEKIPEELLDWRPTDPNGHFQFSLSEIAMHVADTRLHFAANLNGTDASDEMWTISDADGAADTTDDRYRWVFKPRGGKEEILASLKRGTAAIEHWLSLPLDQLQQPTQGTRANFDKFIAAMVEKGEDTTPLELRGPATVNRTLFVLVAHEAGHRGTLQTLLRLNGVDARGDH